MQKEIVLHRINTCKSCENMFTTFGIIRCKLCGCAMQAKVLLKDSKCPIDKWGSEE
jgi:hypothetical protein